MTITAGSTNGTTSSQTPLADRLNPLLQRYDVAVPRYTSYPPIPCWHEIDAPTAAAWMQSVEPQGESALSLYTHVPFCKRRCHYCGCHVVISPRLDPADRYVDAVCAEMKMVAELAAANRIVHQYHLGGGTPNFLPPALLERLVREARQQFVFAADAELSIEADPRFLDRDYLQHLRSLGFSRLSLGVQDLDAQVQCDINRIEPIEHLQQVVQEAREEGFTSVNLDLIYGLPHQTAQSFPQTIQRVIGLRPERLAAYNFAYLPGAFPHQRKMSAEALPDPAEKLQIFLEAREALLGAGYHAIGLDHFALPDDALALAHANGTLRRNFMGYTTLAGTDVLAFGVSGISEFNGHFWQNEKKLVRYERCVESGQLPATRGLQLTADDRLRQHAISALFCQGQVNLDDLSTRFGVDAQAYLREDLTKLDSLEADGLVERSPDQLTVSDTGQFFLRNIAVALDNRTGRIQGPQYSRSV